MLYPITVVDDFFTKPDVIKNYSKEFNYQPCQWGQFPGTRSPKLGVENHTYNFFDFVCRKFISILYPHQVQDIDFKASLQFQRISNEFKNPGFVHSDYPAELTAIVYLSDHENCGTSFFEPIFIPDGIRQTDEIKNNIYKFKYFDKELETANECNKHFKETLTVSSKYNRAVLFDSSYYHGVKNFINENTEEDRLTLIAFFDFIHINGIKYPLIENRRRG